MVSLQTQFPPGPGESLTIRPFGKTDIEFVTSRQLALYRSEYGFVSPVWIEYLTRAVQDFVTRFDPACDGMFILEHTGESAGCVAIARTGPATAQLRFFFVEPGMRGLGCGKTLLDQALGFCRERNCTRVFLWTFSTLLAARHLYESRGFHLTETRNNNEWGEPVLEERWDLEL